MKNTQLNIKEHFKNTVIGFNHSAAPLGHRNDLHLLYDLAKKKNLVHLLDMFEDAPAPEVIEEAKVAIFEEKQAFKNKSRNREQ